MHFEPTTIAAIRSMSQRSLALAWSRAAGENAYPAFSQFNPPDRSHDPNYMTIWKVEQATDRFDYVAMFQGKHISTVFKQQWQGRRMSEVIPEPLRLAALAAANHCREAGRGVFMVYRTVAPDKSEVLVERVLLPFGEGGRGIQQIVASMEPISMVGNVILERALDSFTAVFDITFAGSFAPQPREEAIREMDGYCSAGD